LYFANRRARAPASFLSFVWSVLFRDTTFRV
jgi:hypothetical protein